MPEATVSLSIEVPKAFLQQALARKPQWLDVTNEQFLGKMFAGGNFDAFFKTYEGSNKELSEAQRVFLQTVKDIANKLGVPIKVPPSDRPARKKAGPKAATRAAEVPASPARPIPA